MIDSLRDERLKKLEALKKAGINAYPAEAERSMTLGAARAQFDKLAETGGEHWLAGRITSVRDQGQILFLDVKDETGAMQFVLKNDVVENFELWKSVLDRGDFISAFGVFFKTVRGEESLEAREVKFLTKALLPVPSEWYGVEDTETRLRKRYLELFVNPETKDIFRKKAIFWQTIRQNLLDEGFLEVETPVLERVPGGAEAEPFKTHHNALDTDFYLRISLELPLKRLVVAGFEKVFEIGRIFRNEGVDKEHLQDYTQMEFYWAYKNYRDLMDFLEPFYKTIVQNVTGGLTTKYGSEEIDWSKPWPKIDYAQAFAEAAGLNPLKASIDELLTKAENLGLSPEKFAGKGRLIDLIYKKTLRPKLVRPCFLIDPPVEVEPLAKRSARDSGVAERLQIVAGCTELGKGFTELNDPLDQRARFEEQMKLRAAGDNEAQMIDEDFIEALEYGMPPTAGFGMSERLFAVLMNKPIRETVIFPLMRPKL